MISTTHHLAVAAISGDNFGVIFFSLIVGGDNVPGSASGSIVATTKLSRSVVSDSINFKKGSSICWLLCKGLCYGPFVLSKS